MAKSAAGAVGTREERYLETAASESMAPTFWLIPLLAIAGGLVAFAALSWMKRRIKRAIEYRVETYLADEAHNLTRARQRAALATSAEFVEAHFQGARRFDTKQAVLQYALGEVDSSNAGLYCEFGVYKGSTINFIAEKIQSTIHGFDSFEGLPENWRDGHDAGVFKLSALPEVRQNVRLHQGWFNETLPRFVQEFQQPIAFLHIDCDLYSSTKTVFEHLRRQVIPGTIIVFDEYFNYPGWLQGEHKAFTEFVAGNGLAFEYIAYNALSEQVAVRITAR